MDTRAWRPCGAIVLALVLLAVAAELRAEPLPAAIPLRRDAEPAPSGGLWMPSLLLLGLAVAAGGYAVWRRGSAGSLRIGARKPEAEVARLSSQSLTPHASVHAVRWAGEEFLLACTSQQVTLLARRPASSEEEGSS